MKHMKIIAMALVLALLLPLFPATALAADQVGFRVSVSTEDARPGEQVEVTVSLTGYTAAAAEADAIRGLQVDLSGADPEVLELVSCTSLIEDTSALTNTASYSEADARARLLYVQMDGTLAPCQDVFKAAFRVNPDLNHDGNITLPVTMKIQTVSRQIVLTGECTISFTATIFSVDLAWGNMEFTYNPGSEGEWDPNSHTYKEGTGVAAGWYCDEGANRITVTNHSNEPVTAAAVFTPTDAFAESLQKEGVRADITGNSTAEGGNVLYLDKAGADQQPVSGSFTVEVRGAVSKAFEDLVLGRITVTIQ